MVVNITTMENVMEEAISAAEANRSFSKVLRSVREGRSVVVTSHGRPIAKIIPVGERDDRIAEHARAALLSRLRREPVMNVGRWTRGELYED
jgi:prevent-host-death family protein